jgi:preprotein translocase subunit SecE
MARNRQRAKQRQQERREQRLRERAEAAGDGRKADPDDPAEIGQVAGETGAPPENVGQSDATVEADASARRELSQEEEDELFLDEEDFEVDQEELAEAEEAYAPKGRRGDRGAPAPGAPTQATGLARVVAFLRACWAELQRVQWPDRRQTTQLTAIVLIFIIIVGFYLGVLDWVVSNLVQEII